MVDSIGVSTGPIRVLYVDGESEAAASTAAALEREDPRFTVEAIAGAEKALEFVAESEVDCVVSEYDVASRDGIELLEAVRANHPNVPFVLFTGAGSETVASEAISVGVTDYVPRGDGSQYAVLANRVAEAVEQYRSERALEALNETTRELMAAESREAVAEITVRAARDVLGLEANAVHLYDEERDVLSPVAATDRVRELVDDVPTFTGGESIAWRVFRDGETLALNDVHDDPDAYNPNSPVQSELHLPIGSFGILIAGSPTSEAFDQQDVVLGEILAENAAAALNQVERTEQLRAREDELERQNERLEEFASVVSHDLRNPLNVASGNLELLREECDSEHIPAVERAHERMNALIEDLLTLARQDDRVEEFESLDPAELVRDCWQNVSTGDAALNVSLNRRFEGDPGQVSQLFENLFRNNVEHGGADVTVTVGELPDGTGFYVEDDGDGIPADECDVVFTAGYSTTPDGTGFGLSIVERVADAHGWTVRATEGSEGGARFEFAGVAFVPDAAGN